MKEPVPARDLFKKTKTVDAAGTRSPIARFSVFCGAVLLIFGATLATIVTTALEKDMLERAQQLTATFVAASVREHFAPEDFAGPRIGRDYDLFAQKFQHFRFGVPLVRTKFWDRSLRMIWADHPGLVGETGSDHHEVKQAFKGEIHSEVSRLQGREHRFEHEGKRLMELYVPVSWNSQGKIEVVCELYQDLEPLYQELAQQKCIIWGATAAGVLLVYLILYRTFASLSRELNRQHQNVIQSEANYRNLVNSARDGIISIDQAGTITFCNQAAAKLFGYCRDELIGMELVQLMPPQYREAHTSSMTGFFTAGGPLDCEECLDLEGLRKSGEIFPLELTLSEARNSDEVRVTAIIRDATLRKTAQQQLIKVERGEAISVIAAGIGHELNNCVTGLKGYASLLIDDPGNTEMAAASAEVFVTSCEKLHLFGKNLLSIGHPQRPEPKELQAGQILDRVADLLLLSGLLRGHTIHKSYHPGLPTILGDEMQLEQVVMNLVINAIHAMDRKGTLTLSTSFDRTLGMVHLTVQDTGHGIAEEMREQIFIPFFTTKAKEKGTGLGLYIVKQIVESHGGKVEIASEVGRGTTVTVGIPVPR